MKVVNILPVFVLVIVCLMCTGCASGPSNCTVVDAGRPFVAQEGMSYGIEEGGITYQFNQGAYPNAQVVYADPGNYYTLQPGSVYVMLIDPTYLVRRQESDESTERLKKTMDDWSHSFDGMFDSTR